MSEIQPDQVGALGLLLSLGNRAREAASAAELGFVVVNETRQLIEYRQSAVWQPGRALVAVSGLPAVESQTPYGQWLDQLCSAYADALLPGQALTLDAGDLDPALAQDWNDWLPAHALLLGMEGAPGKLAGIWLLAREAPWSEPEMALLQQLCAVYSHAWRLHQPHPHWRARARAMLGGTRRKKRIAIGVAVALLLPVRLSVLAPAEVVPKGAFLVRAPLDGVVDRLHVRPNQPVQQNQPLFDLDTTALRARLGVASKAYEAAAEEYRQSAQLAVSDDEKGRLEMTQRKGRMDEKAAEMAYSAQLLDRVQVKAARAGVAVFSDPNDWIGKGVTVGERVMQIADPSQVEIAIRLPVADAIALSDGANVTLFLTTAPQYAYDARLSYGAYRPEGGSDGIVAYKVKADFAPGETPPRLGLTGTAKLHGAWVPLFYYVLRRPLAAARQAIGW